MGADLYRTGHDAIREAHEAQWNAALAMRETDPELGQKAVDAAWEAMYPASHYFRDSYNDSSLFWKLDLSWWQDLQPYVNDDCTLHQDGMRRLISEIESRRDTFHANIAHESPEDQQYFRDKLSRLTAFLHDAAEAGDEIGCSV